MDRYKAMGTRLKKGRGRKGKVDGPRCEKTLIQKRSMLVHSGELVLLYFSIGDKT
jgi:hypothetical protein